MSSFNSEDFNNNNIIDFKDDIYITHLDGHREKLNINAVQNKINMLINKEPKLSITGSLLIVKIITHLKNGMNTEDIDFISSKISSSLISVNEDYSELSLRILQDRNEKIKNIKRIKPNVKNTIKNDQIYVIHNDGTKQELNIQAVKDKIDMLINKEPKLSITGDILVTKVINELADNITSNDIDYISSKLAANLTSVNLDYSTLAARIIINRIHKTCFMNDYLLYALNINEKLNNYFVDKFLLFIKNYKNEINKSIDFMKDYQLQYIGVSILKKSYLINNKSITLESPQQMYMRVAINLHLNDMDKYGNLQTYTFKDVYKLYKYLSDGYYTHATPTLFNSGNHVGSLSSCFLLDVEDTTMGIYNTLAESAMISKSAGGIGINIQKVRGKNSRIVSSNGISEGLIPMLKVYDDMAKHMSQGGGKRKGSIAVYFELWHMDVMDVLESILPINSLDESNCPRDLFYAAWTNDIFWQRLEYAILNPDKYVKWSLFCPNIVKTDRFKNMIGLTDTYGDEFSKLYETYEAEQLYVKQINILEIWNKILKVLEEAGKLYILSKSACNMKCNQNNLGIIKSSNLCVHGQTVILTDKGYYTIKNLVGEEVNVWNGEEFSKTTVIKTGENKKLLQITTSDGCFLKCTEYHKFYVVDKNKKNNKKNAYIVEAKDLKRGMKLLTCNFPKIDNNFKNLIFDNNNDINNIKTSEYYEHEIMYNKGYNFITNTILNNKEYNVIPINYNLKNKLSWLAGYIDYEYKNTQLELLNHNHITLSNNDYRVLYKIKLLCNTLGLKPVIIEDSLVERKCLFFNNIESYNLMVKLNLQTVSLYGARSQLNKNKDPLFVFENNVYIKNIIEVDGLHDTYCFNEPKNHMGVFNGILTGNCSEILIYTDENNIGVCNLASICLPKFVLDKDTYNYDLLFDVAYDVTINLNKVIDNNVYPLEKAKNSDMKNRPIGIGVQGLADVFMAMKCSFTSTKAKKINKNIFETIYIAALTASKDLAIKYGYYENYPTSMIANNILQFDLWNINQNDLLWNKSWIQLRNDIKQYGLYNSLLVALMPTASTAAILDNSENFEPITSNIYNRSLLSGDFQVVNKYLINDLKRLNIWNDTMRQRIIADNGSVQNIDEIPNDIKEIYKTAYEYKLKDLIDMDRDRCCFVCQSMSSNRFIADFNPSKITSMYLYAWKQGLKTLSYYIRTKTNVNAIKFTIDKSILDKVKKNTNKNTNNKQEDECLMCSA